MITYYLKAIRFSRTAQLSYHSTLPPANHLFRHCCDAVADGEHVHARCEAEIGTAEQEFLSWLQLPYVTEHIRERHAHERSG